MFTALDHIADTVHTLATGTDPVTIDGTHHDGLPNGPVPINEVAQFLLRSTTSPATRDGIWRHIVTESRTNQQWAIIAAGLALPGLRHAAARVARIFPHTTDSDGDSEVLTGFLTALQAIDETKPRICSRLCQAAFSTGRTYARRQIATARAQQESAHSQVPAPPYGHVDLVLLRAVDEGVVTSTGAKLISATRLDGASPAKAASSTGLTLIEAKRIRGVDEKRLLCWILGGAG